MEYRRSLWTIRVLVALTAAFFVVAFFWVSLGRFGYPFELDWMSGALLDHVERVRSGMPVYVEPGPDFIPFLYPPGPYYITASLGRWMPLAVAYRVLSIAATLVQAVAVYGLARLARATRAWALLGVGLFFGCYKLNAFFYDLERPDPLTVALLASAVWLLSAARAHTSNGKRRFSVVLAGVLTGAAILCKQQALPFFIVLAVLCLRQMGWRLALLFVGTTCAVFLPVAAALEVRSQGWFSFYVLGVPLRHGTKLSLLPIFLFEDLPMALLLLTSTIALCYRPLRSDHPFLVAALATGFCVAAMSRMHEGGWKNVLLFWSTFACAGAAVLLTRVEAALDAQPWGKLVPLALLFGQLLLLVYLPTDVLPAAGRKAVDETIASSVSTLEKQGEVLVHGRGHFTVRPHYHLAALEDLLKETGTPPTKLVEAITSQRFFAIVVGRIEEFRQMAPLVLSHYELHHMLFDPSAHPGIEPGTVPSTTPRLVLFRRSKSHSPSDVHED